MVNSETDLRPHKTSRRYLTIIIQQILLQNSQHQEFDRVLKFSEKYLMIIKYTKQFWLTKNMFHK